VITHFNTTVSMFHDWFWRIETRPNSLKTCLWLVTYSTFSELVKYFLEFRRFVTTDFNTIFSAFRDWFWWIEMSQCGYWFGLSYPSATTQMKDEPRRIQVVFHWVSLLRCSVLRLVFHWVSLLTCSVLRLTISFTICSILYRFVLLLTQTLMSEILYF
jgi:hypothetical protein